MLIELNVLPQYSKEYLCHYYSRNPLKSLHKRVLDSLRIDEVHSDTTNSEIVLCSELAEQSIDALMYACMEYAKHTRPYTETERLEYLLDKCKEFNGMI
jgi:signal transduction protein with GAF and PtsI domain